MWKFKAPPICNSPFTFSWEWSSWKPGPVNVKLIVIHLRNCIKYIIPSKPLFISDVSMLLFSERLSKKIFHKCNKLKIPPPPHFLDLISLLYSWESSCCNLFLKKFTTMNLLYWYFYLLLRKTSLGNVGILFIQEYDFMSFYLEQK